MKRLMILAFCMSAAVFMMGCAPADAPITTPAKVTDAETAYHKITAEEAKAMIDKGDVTIVDVRRADEYAASHIPGAILVPNETIADEAATMLPDKNATLLVHCRTGIRSKQASDKLVALGYTAVYDFGGIVDWPYETEAGEFVK